MIRLIGFEFGKIVKRRVVLASLAVLVILGLMLYMGNGPQGVICRLPDGEYIGGGEAVAYEKKVAAEYEGVLTEEKAQRILEQYAPEAPDGGVWTVNSTYNTIQSWFGNRDGSYNGLTVEEAFPDYEGEEPLILGYADGYAGFLFTGMYLMMAVGVVLAIALSPVFSQEYASGTDALILASRHGKRRCGRAKVLAAYLFTLLVTGSCFLVMILIFLAGFGLTGGGSSIQLNNRDLLRSLSYSMTCLEAAGTCLVLWLAGALILTAVILVLSALCRTSFVTLIAALALYILPMLGSALHIPRRVMSLAPFWCFLSEWTLEIPKIGGRISWVCVPMLLGVVLVPLTLYLGSRIFARHQAA